MKETMIRVTDVKTGQTLDLTVEDAMWFIKNMVTVSDFQYIVERI